MTRKHPWEMIQEEMPRVYPWVVTPEERRKYFRHCYFGKGGSTTVNNSSTYTPTKYEKKLQQLQADYAKAISPNSLWLNDTARNILQDSIGAVQVDFGQLNQNAQNQINAANQGMANLANGQLPTAYTDSMTDAIRSTLNNTMGQSINGLANRGVLNSSVTGAAMNDISKNAADTTAQNYLQNISTLGNIYNNQQSTANNGITTAAAAQEAAQVPAINLWNASLGLNGSGTSALAAAAGQGTTNSTSTTHGGGGGLFSSLFG